MSEAYKRKKLSDDTSNSKVPQATNDTLEKWNKQLQERLRDLTLPERTRIWLQSQLNFNINGWKTRMDEEDQDDWNTGI